jgi:hypothetical protein
VLALLTLYGRDVGIRTEKLTPLARLVMELAGVSQPSNRPVTGTRLFDVESGIIATWVRNVRDTDPTESFPYLPELVGQPGAQLVLGKGSGVDNVAEWLDRIGATASDEERLEILGRGKETSLRKKGLLDREEFEPDRAGRSSRPQRLSGEAYTERAGPRGPSGASTGGEGGWPSRGRCRSRGTSSTRSTRRAASWGVWGPDDQRGALNSITPEIVAGAAGLIRTGRTVSRARGRSTRRPGPTAEARRAPHDDDERHPPGRLGATSGSRATSWASSSTATRTRTSTR